LVPGEPDAVDTNKFVWLSDRSDRIV
jgi:hypothetical protein